MKKTEKRCIKIISVILTALIVASLLPAGTLLAHAETNFYYKYGVNYDTRYYASTFEQAWAEAQSSANGVVGTLTNVTLSDTLTVPNGKNITLELNGNILDRGCMTASAEKDHNVITVGEGSTLTVYGGTAAAPKPSGGWTFTVWDSVSATKQYTLNNKGVITGGRNTYNGGGIAIEKNGTCNLYHTAVSGNRADDGATTIGGYGGGIALRGDYAKLNMHDSEVSYNVAEVGGGICVRDAEYTSITMERTDTAAESSSILHNIVSKDGGGIAVSGSSDNCKIKGDGDAEQGDRKSKIEGNSATGDGGGIHLNSENVVINGFDIDYNYAGNGGGLYLDDETCSIKNCYLYNNNTTGDGGAIYNNNDATTLDTVRVMNNTASKKGDGIYSYGTVDVALAGKCVIKSNDTQNLYLDHNVAQNSYVDDSLSKGSEVYITYGSDHVSQLTKKPGTYDDSFFYSDTSGYYFKWFPRDSGGAHNDRNIYRVSGTKPGKATPTVVNSRTTATDKTYQGEPVIRGIFEYPAAVDDTIDREATFYYSDGYFKDSALTYNEHLASASSALVMASMYSSIGGGGSNSAEYRDKSNNIRQMMSDIGCKDEDIYVNDFNVRRPTNKTIGVCISSKDLPDGEKLVVIGIRGANYEAEWASNVSIGSTGEANGFRDAANTVFAELEGYLNKRNINGSSSKTKYWVAGFSRAGATANLTAKRIVDKFDNNGTRTFAYPIEAPKGGRADEKKSGCNYNCIHNVLNYCDLVPWVAPGEMGFIRYGKDHYVPGSSYIAGTADIYDQNQTNHDNYTVKVGSSTYQTQKAKMLVQLAAMNEDVVYDDYFHMATINYIDGAVGPGEFIAESDKYHSGTQNLPPENWIPKFWKAFQGWGFDFNGDAATTDRSTSNDWQVSINSGKGDAIRTNFASTKVKSSQSFQEALAYVMNMVFGMDGEKKEKVMGCLDGIVDRIGTTKLIGIYTNYINKDFSGIIGSSDYNQTVEDIWKALTVLSTEDEAKGYHSLTEYLSESELEELHSALPALVYPILEFVANDYEGYNQDHAGTLANNAGRLIQNHYPEVAASWLRSYDSYYDNDTTPVTLKEGTGGKEKPHYPAVEVKSYKTGHVTTYDGTSSAIVVDVRDEVRLVPNNSNYKNTGEGIYYCYPNARNEDSRGWHGFSDPIIFKNLNYEDYSDYGADGSTFTIDTFSAHYDMAADGTKTTGMSSGFDNTKRTYNFVVNRPYDSGKYYTALQNVNLTGNARTDIVNIAKSQNGYMEGNNANQLDGYINGSNNYTEYGRWYGLQDMWCSMFVSWCANKAGVDTTVIPKTASTVTALNYFINQGVAYTRASVAAGNYKPEAGDIVFFKSDRNTAKTNHIGIVTSYSGTTINTIEGNTSSATISTNGGCVRAKSYSITNTYIVYVCRPKYTNDTVSGDNVEFDSTKYDYRSWPNADTRWGNRQIGTGSATVGNSSGITTAATKLAIQAGTKTASEYNVSDFVTDMNRNNGYTAAGAMYWDKAQTILGFDGVNNNLMSESESGVSFDTQKQQILNWILEGKHMALSVTDSKGVKSWVAVDEAMTLSTGEIYVMDASTDLETNANVKAKDKFVNIKRIACFTGGQIAYELIGSDDYRIWRKFDSRWKETKLGGSYDVYAKGDLIMAATKLAIQAGLKNPQLYTVNNAIEDTKKGSNGGFSDAGNMYWADASQALGFDGYNANLLSSGTYSSTGYYNTIKNYINAGKHMAILVNDNTHNGNEIWVAVDEARTLSTGYIWVWRSNADAVSGGEKTGDNMYRLDTLNSNFKRVACFTGGKIKTTEDHFVYLPGSFNGWKENREMTQREDGKCEKTLYLPKGNYEFKILADGYWYGNNGTITNTNQSDGDGNGWEFTGEGNNCTLSVTYDGGGYFTFLYVPVGNSYERHLKVTYSAEPPQEGEVGPIIDSGATDYRKWNITDTRWGSVKLGTNKTKSMSATDVGYGDLYAAAAKLMIATGLSTPESMDPGKMAELIRSHTQSGMFDWDGLASETALTKVNTSLLPNGTYETRLGGKKTSSSGKTFKQYILEDHYHLFVKIDDDASGYGWALVDEAMTASATGGEIYVWLSKSTSSKSTDDNPVLLSSISTTFKRVAAFKGGSNIVQSTFSGNNNAEVTATYSFNDTTSEINSGDYIPNGAVVSIKGTPADDYEYDTWTHNLGSGESAPTITPTSLKYTATAAATITYKTKPKECKINYSDASHFTYAASNPKSAAPGASVCFTITPETDYLATVFVESASGDTVNVTKSNNSYTFTMPNGDVNVSVEMNYDDYRSWSKSDSRWANTKLGTSSYKVSGATAGMGDLVVAVTKLSKQAGSNVTDINDAVARLKAGGGLGSTGYLDWAGTVNSNMSFTGRNTYNTSGTVSSKTAEIITGIKAGKHYVIKINNTKGWVAVDEKLTLLTGEIYVMCSGDNADDNADVRLSDISTSFSNYAYFTGGDTTSPTERTVTFTDSPHIVISASYSVGDNDYNITSGDKVFDGVSVHFKAVVDPDYEFGNWECNLTPEQQDTAELVVTATGDIVVTCTEMVKDSPDTIVNMKIEYCYKDYDPSLSNTYEYKEGDEYLTGRSVISQSAYQITGADLRNPAALRQKVVQSIPTINSDYLNFNRTIGENEDFTSATTFDQAQNAYIVSVDMTSSTRKYSVKVNNNKGTKHHFQEEVTLKASDYNVSNAVWENDGTIVAIGDTYKFRVAGNMKLKVRTKTDEDPDYLTGKSIITYAYKTVTTSGGVEKCSQNFYIQNHIDVNDTSKTFIGAGAFYYIYDDKNDEPVNALVTQNDVINHLEEYTLGFENTSTGKGNLSYNNSETGLSFSYHNYAQDSALQSGKRILRSPSGAGYVNYILNLETENQRENADKYSYRVYSFYLYSEGGTTYAVVSDNHCAAKLFSAE